MKEILGIKRKEINIFCNKKTCYKTEKEPFNLILKINKNVTEVRISVTLCVLVYLIIGNKNEYRKDVYIMLEDIYE